MLILLFLIPLALGLGAEYACCRFFKRRAWRYLPPVVTALAGLAVTLARYHGWSREGEKAPLETLLFVPGLSLLGLFLGIFLGYRIWKRLWTPRVIKDKKVK